MVAKTSRKKKKAADLKVSDTVAASTRDRAMPEEYASDPRKSSFIRDSMAGRLLRRLPGGNLAEEQLERIEHRVLRELKQRLDDVGEPASVSVLAVSVSESPEGAGAPARMPGDILRALLEQSTEQHRDEAEAEYFCKLLRALVPDEARILAALSDGTAYPLIHVFSGPKFGMATHAEVECVCTIGKNAGVQCQELASDYVRHLVRLGLATVDVTEINDAMRYQILETDTAVRMAMEAARHHGRRGQIVRRSLRITDTGKRLWAACRISEDAPGW